MIWIETPSNPLMKIIDIEKVVQIAKNYSLEVVADNTFASPYLQNPLDLGCSIVVHSATKYLSGHSDTIMGAVVVNSSIIAEKLFFIQNTCGSIPGPNDCFLVLRGIKTLSIRMERQCYNTHKIVDFLSNNSKIKRVLWPGLRSHKNHIIARKQMKDFGAMISFELNSGSVEKSFSLVENLKLFTIAESLGGVESLCCHPSIMTHASISKEERN